MPDKPLETVMTRFREIEIPEHFDIVVAIANGGLVPAAILNQRLHTRLEVIRIHLRDEHQRPQYDEPQLLEPVAFDVKGKRILLVDDRIKTGSTIQLAKAVLHEAAVIKTFAVNGQADYALFDEACFRFPWIL